MSALFTGISNEYLLHNTGWVTTQAFTLFGRFKRTSTKNNASLLGYGKTAATFIAADDSASGTVGTQVYINGGPNPTGLLPQLPANAWQSVCITWNGSLAPTPTTVVWVGGTKVYNQANALAGSSTDIFFGSCGYQSFIGKLGTSYSWSAVLTDPQITAQMSQQAPITVSGLLGYWKLNGDGLDSGGGGNDLSAGGTAISYDTADNPTYGSSASGGGFFAACSKFAGRTASAFKRRFHPVLLPDGYRRRPSGLLVPA